MSKRWVGEGFIACMYLRPVRYGLVAQSGVVMLVFEGDEGESVSNR